MEMKDIKEFLDDIKEDDEYMDSFASMMYGAMKSLEKTSKEDYKKLKKMIEERDIGSDDVCIDEEEAQMIVGEMRNKNEKGEHWSINQIQQLGKQRNIKFDDFSEADLYLIMNMYYYDSKSVLGNSVDNYLNMALSFLNDEDCPTSPSEKVYNYFCYVAQMIDDEDNEDDYGNDYPEYENGRYDYYDDMGRDGYGSRGSRGSSRSSSYSRGSRSGSRGSSRSGSRTRRSSSRRSGRY